MQSVLGNNAEGVFRRKKKSEFSDGAIEWLCCGLSLPLEVLPSQAVSVHWAAPVSVPSSRAIWCSPSQSLGCARTRELFECKANFAVLSTLQIASTGAKTLKLFLNKIVSSFRYGRCPHSGNRVSQGGLSGIIMPGES